MKKHLHCIGIGGIGVSALARFYHAKGFKVSGSDPRRSENTDQIRKLGIPIALSKRQRGRLPRSVDLVIHTVASPQDEYERRELKEARRREIRVLSYPQAVGELTKIYKTIAVAGAHGKSTTTAMIGLMLTRAGLDPTVIVGTKLKEFGDTNFRLGSSPYLVLEADEYRGSFWNYRPWVAVVTNIDREHLDFYRNLAGVARGFKKFIAGVNHDGHLVLNADDQQLRAIARGANPIPKSRISWFSRNDREARSIRSALKIPGAHNVSNALAAYRAGEILGIPKRKIFGALSRYRGSWRRFDYQGIFALGRQRAGLADAKVFADYAHHPTEIKATLQATREKFPKARIWCVFQPHHYERTRDLFGEFSRAFDGADAAVLLDIYEVAGRERKGIDSRVNSERLAAAINRRGVPALYLKDPEHRLKPFLKRWLRAGDVLLMTGAGDIWEMTKALMQNEKRKV